MARAAWVVVQECEADDHTVTTTRKQRQMLVLSTQSPLSSFIECRVTAEGWYPLLLGRSSPHVKPL